MHYHHGITKFRRNQKIIKCQEGMYLKTSPPMSVKACLPQHRSHCQEDNKLKQAGIYMMAGVPTMEDVPVKSA